MGGMTRKLLVLPVLVAAALATTATAHADGLPSGVDADPGGVTAPGLHVNYIVVPAGRGTVLGRVDRDHGRLLASRYVGSRFSMPSVALDGTPGGLSHDGRTLVLIRPRATFPQRATTLAVVDPLNLRSRKRVRLRGDFSYDALSPDGRTLYLIQYTSRRDITRYAVRAYDLARNRLLPGRIVDRREPDEDMSGLPLTRATSADGRWAYTLYDGTRYRFVHALDTVRREAFCIDLKMIGENDLLGVRLQLVAGGRTLEVRRRHRPLAFVDTRTFRVSTPGAPRAAATREADGGAPWPVIGGAIAALLAAAGAARAVRRRRRIPARA
jgi:hypothetical protein